MPMGDKDCDEGAETMRAQHRGATTKTEEGGMIKNEGVLRLDRGEDEGNGGDAEG